MADDFNAEQKRYLEGFSHGIAAIRMTGGLAAGGTASAPPAEPTGPDASHIKAQDRTVKNGGKLAEQEKWKRAENPFDGHNRLIAEAARGPALVGSIRFDAARRVLHLADRRVGAQGRHRFSSL